MQAAALLLGRPLSLWAGRLQELTLRLGLPAGQSSQWVGEVWVKGVLFSALVARLRWGGA